MIKNKQIQTPQIHNKIKEKIIGYLTPKNTEEIKSNLFIQQIKGESIFSRLDKIVKGNKKSIQWDKYRQITPVAWNGKIISWITLILGANPVKSTLIFLFILFMAWSYQHDLQSIKHFYANIAQNGTVDELRAAFGSFDNQTINLSSQDISNATSQILKLNISELNITT